MDSWLEVSLRTDQTLLKSSTIKSNTMTAAETDPAMEQHERSDDLRQAVSKTSEKLDDYQAESESIASALQGDGLEGEDEPQAPNDLEKAPTEASHANHSQANRIVTAVDWNGPDDPENPFNWSIAKKWGVTILACFMTFAVQINGTMMTSAAYPPPYLAQK